MGCGASAQKYIEDIEDKPARPGADAPQETLDFLSKVPLFRQLSEGQLPLLAEACEPRTFGPGETIIKQGEVGKEFFIIKSGEAVVSFRDSLDDPAPGARRTSLDGGTGRVTLLKVGDYFGEKSLVQDVPRSATIVASTALHTLQITRVKFRELGLNEKLHFRKRKALGNRGPAKQTKAKPPSAKSEAERNLIATALRQNENLQVMVVLDEERINSMIDVCWKEWVKKGRVLIGESDGSADYFYVVQEGLFEVSVLNDPDGTEDPDMAPSRRRASVKALGPGTSFGEMALLCSAPRSATISAAIDSSVWVFDRDNFKDILMKNTRDKIEEHEDYLTGVEILQCLLPNERREIAEALVELIYDKGELVLEQGKVGTAFYILVEGEVSVIKDGKEVRRLQASLSSHTSAYFGEMALLNREPRTASVRVESDTATVLVLDRESFDLLLGPLEDLMKSNKEDPTRGKKNKGKKKKAPIYRDELSYVSLMGCGAFGTVDLCEHKRTRQYYALKIVSKSYIVANNMQATIMNEKDVWMMCDSPFVIRLFATYNTSQTLQFLLEPAMGGDLHMVFQSESFYGSKTHTLFYSAGVIIAFEHLHKLRIAYRNLKPENVVLNDQGNIKLTDMGIAKVCVKAAYTVCGTPDYFAPEMIKQTGHAVALDWWTLGVFLFELLSGEPPFQAKDAMQTYRKIIEGISGVHFPPSCMGSVSGLIKELLTEDPNKRLPMLPQGLLRLQEHNFYRGLNWAAFKEFKVMPPFQPQLRGPKDTRYCQADPSNLPASKKYVNDGSGWDLDFASC